MKKKARTWTCQIDGQKFPTLSAVRKHYWDAHREVHMRAFKPKRGRPPGAKNKNSRPNSHAVPRLHAITAEEMLNAVRVKRDLLNEVIAEWEKMLL